MYKIRMYWKNYKGTLIFIGSTSKNKQKMYG